MFTIFDIAILTVMIMSSALGLYRGMISIIINFLGFVGSIILTIILFPYINNFLLAYVQKHMLVAIVSGSIGYILSLLLTTLITTKIITLLSFITQKPLDRALGLALGVFRGLIISLIIFATVAIVASGAYIKADNLSGVIDNLHDEKYPDYLTQSKTSEFLEHALKTSLSFAPPSIMKYNFFPKKINKDEIKEMPQPQEILEEEYQELLN